MLESGLTDSPDFDHPEKLRAELVSGPGRFIAVVQKAVSKGLLEGEEKMLKLFQPSTPASE